MDTRALTNLFKALASERRVRIVKILMESERPIASSMLAELLEIPDGSTSHNLTKLYEVGLVNKIQSGSWVLYEINDEVLKVLRGFFDGKAKMDEPASKV